jgi:hypothetical protein
VSTPKGFLARFWKLFLMAVKSMDWLRVGPRRDHKLFKDFSVFESVVIKEKKVTFKTLTRNFWFLADF